MAKSSTSSSDVDGEEEERLRSVAVDSASVTGMSAYKKKQTNDNSTAPKFYQARARDLLFEYLDQNFEIKTVKNESSKAANDHSVEIGEDAGFRLFKRAPTGLSEKLRCQETVSTRKRKHGDNDLHESSEMFQANLQAAAIDGMAVKLYAEKAKEKAFSTWLLREAEEREAKRKEDERVAMLKRERGEQWLPSVAKDMQTCEVLDGKALIRDASVTRPSEVRFSMGLHTSMENGYQKSTKK